MPRNQVAPGQLELVREFVNTYDVEDGTDSLATVEGAAEWVEAHDPPVGRGFGEDDRERLVGVREGLRGLLAANGSGEPPPPAAIELLNEQAPKATLGLRFSREGAELVSACGGTDSAIAQLLSIVHESMHAGTWQRLKVCPAEDCQWAFYDHSRNRSGTWCTMGVCGNRAKARTYRERHRAESGR